MSDSSVGQSVCRPCPCCEGAGCSECDNTGQRVTTYIEDGEVSMRVQGSAPLSGEAWSALTELGRVAYERIDRANAARAARGGRPGYEGFPDRRTP